MQATSIALLHLASIPHSNTIAAYKCENKSSASLHSQHMPWTSSHGPTTFTLSAIAQYINGWCVKLTSPALKGVLQGGLSSEV